MSSWAIIYSSAVTFYLYCLNVLEDEFSDRSRQTSHFTLCPVTFCSKAEAKGQVRCVRIARSSHLLNTILHMFKVMNRDSRLCPKFCNVSSPTTRWNHSFLKYYVNFPVSQTLRTFVLKLFLAHCYSVGNLKALNPINKSINVKLCDLCRQVSNPQMNESPTTVYSGLKCLKSFQ